MKTFKLIGMALLAIILCVNLTACSSDDEQHPLVGSWKQIFQDGSNTYEYIATFKADGTGTSEERDLNVTPVEVEIEHFTYTVKGDQLTTTLEGEQSQTVTYSIQGDKLTITGEDGDKNEYTRVK